VLFADINYSLVAKTQPYAESGQHQYELWIVYKQIRQLHINSEFSIFHNCKCSELFLSSAITTATLLTFRASTASATASFVFLEKDCFYGSVYSPNADCCRQCYLYNMVHKFTVLDE
jgi:hypothetical protein